MSSNRKYISKISKGNDTLYLKDIEAREALPVYSTVADGIAAANELT